MRRLVQGIITAALLLVAFPANAAIYLTFYGSKVMTFKFNSAFIGDVVPGDPSYGIGFVEQEFSSRLVEPGPYKGIENGLGDLSLATAGGKSVLNMYHRDNEKDYSVVASITTTSSAFANSNFFSTPLEYYLGPEDVGDVSYNTAYAIGSFAPNRFTVSFAPPVPEPATWAMMILGFAAMGVALRRKRFNTRTPHTAAR